MTDCFSVISFIFIYKGDDHIGSNNKKFTYEEVKIICKDNGFELNSLEYINARSCLSMTCENGHTTQKTINSIKQGTGCDICAREIRKGKRKLSFEDVKSYIESYDYKLISTEYINAKELMMVECPLGHLYMVNFDNFKYANRRCHKCDILSKTQEGHWNWQGGLTSDAMKIRNSQDYKDWRSSVFERDDFICQCCNRNSKHLEAHHIENFSNNEELRLDIVNGITLCENCHSIFKIGSFHNIYGSHNNTKEQLEEYIQIYRSGKFNELKLKNIS